MLEVVQGNHDRTLAANSGRVATYLRPASENMHTFKQMYRLFDIRVHNARLEAIGGNMIDHYNQLYGQNLGQEWKEASKLSAEYLVMGGRWNQDHPKFFR